jgi:polar amino acid transport system permease protein
VSGVVNPGGGRSAAGDAADVWVPSEHELARRAARRAQSSRRILVAVVSSVVVIGGLVLVVLTSQGWPVVQETFFDVDYGFEVLPAVFAGFTLNLRLLVICSIVIAVLSLLLALARTSRAAALTPFRLLATGYVDLFRGIPLLLVIYLIGFGVPALQLPGISTVDVFWLGALAVSISYSAYVAEVLRAGILSVHPSQRAAARSLGLSQPQTMRHVVLPQAVRSVAPALLNDFVSLLKDTGLISVLGVIDAIRAAQIAQSRSFNFTPYVVAAILFLIVTVPLTRLTDRVLLRQLARQNAQGAA